MVPIMARSKNVTRGKSLGEALRGGLSNFFADMRKEGKTTSDIWAELFKEDAATAMRLAISLTPKELDLKVTNEDAASTIDPVDWEVLRAAHAESKRDETTH